MSVLVKKRVVFVVDFSVASMSEYSFTSTDYPNNAKEHGLFYYLVEFKFGDNLRLDW